MKIKQKMITYLFVALASFVALFGGVTVSAVTQCGDTETNIINCDVGKDTDGNGTIDPIESNAVWGLLILVINILTVGVGIAGVGGITYGAIKYATAGGNFETAKKALGVITNTGIGLLAYALMFAILNYIIPGGVFT